jgi:anti-sigma factor RsiW
MRLRRRPELVCRDVVELVSDYLEGALDARDRARFEAHLAGCDGCSAYLEEMRAAIRVAGSLAPMTIDPQMHERLVQAFRDWRTDG